MSQLKELLGDLYTPEIEGKIGSRVVYIWNKEDEKEKDKEPIPKHRVNEMTDTLKTKVADLEGQLKTYEGTLEAKEKDLKTLKKQAEGNEELTNKITELQNQYKEEKEAREKDKETSVQKEVELKKALSLKELLLNSGVEDTLARNALAKNFDLEKLEADEKGEIKEESFQSQFKPFKENPVLSRLIGKEVIAGQEHNEGEVDTTGDFITREQAEKMTQDEVSQNLEKINKSMEKW